MTTALRIVLCRCILLVISSGMCLFSAQTTTAQNAYTVQSTVQLIPPYSTSLADYTQPGSEKLRVILLQRDLSQTDYQIRLFFSIIHNGRIIMRTARSYNPPPIALSPGVPTVLSGSDLAAYFESRNLDFVGYDRALYERTKVLQEGSVQICVTAYFYARPEVQVSNQGCSFYYLAKSEPPLITQPACGTKVPHREPTQLIFQWLPRSTASPNSAASTEYNLELFEVRLPGRNPNDIVLSQPPVFRVTTSQSLYLYSVADPPLVQGLEYVWRVQARDQQGRDDFRNNGYSQVCSFTYGGSDDPAFAVGTVQRFRATGTAPQAGRMQWQAGDDFDSYRVYYQKSGVDHGWAQADSRDSVLTVNGLEADNEYQTRIQGVKNGTYGPFSEIVSFRTPKLRVVLCGAGGSDSLAQADVNRPLLDALSGDMVEVDGQQMQLIEVENLGDGYYRGKGKMFVDLLGGLGFKTTFERLYIDADRIVGRGRINYVSRGVDNMIVKQVTNQKERQANRELERLKAANREKYKDTEFYEKVFAFPALVVQNVELKADGTVLITVTDAEGRNVTSPQPAMSQALKDNPAKAMIIEDKNGDQWVVQQGKPPEKVTGGGVSPNNGVVISSETLDIVKKALRKLRQTYTDARLSSLEQTMTTKKTDLQNYITQHNKAIHHYTPAVTSVAVTNSSTNNQVNAQSQFIEVNEAPAEDQLFKTKSIAYKQAERLFNKGSVIFIFARENNSAKDYTILAEGMRLNDQPLNQYTAQQKQAGKTTDALVSEVATAVEVFIDKMLDQYMYAK